MRKQREKKTFGLLSIASEVEKDAWLSHNEEDAASAFKTPFLLIIVYLH